MDIVIFKVNPLSVNSYLLVSGNECVFIDPGFYTDEEKAKVALFIEKNNLIPKMMIATHLHIDHIMGAKFLKEKFGIPFLAHKEEEFMLEKIVERAKFYLNLDVEQPPNLDGYLSENQNVKFGETKLEILETPGHSPGGISILNRKEKVVFTGDTLFKGTIGRTDIPGADFDLIMKSIKQKLFKLADDFTVYPGHGQPTTIGTEKRTNPFLI